MARTTTFLLAGLSLLTMGFAQSDIAHRTAVSTGGTKQTYPLRNLDHNAFSPARSSPTWSTTVG